MTSEFKVSPIHLTQPIILCCHTVPAPTSVMVAISTSNPIFPIGSAANLTCNIHLALSSALDTSVVMNVAWTGPHELFMNSSQPVVQDTTTYTSTFTISSLERNHSGVYECEVTLLPANNAPYIIDSIGSVHLIDVATGEKLLWLTF